MNYTRLYVTTNGAWGVIDENEFAIINCQSWTPEDFIALDEASDSEKIEIARQISAKRIQESINA